jgi:tetratricopeptide (TPR) repeat protein
MFSNLFYKAIIISLVFISNCLISQETGYLEIKGKVNWGKDGVEDAKVVVYEGGKIINNLVSDKRGRIDLKLPIDKTYILEFSKKDLVTKRVKVITDVKEKQYVWSYPFTIELFEMLPGLEVSALSEPVTVIQFDNTKGDFGFDAEYTNSMKSKIDKILEQHKVLKKKEYEIVIKMADDLFKQGKYAEAINYYDKAIDLDPFLDYADKRIELCESKIATKEKDDAEYAEIINLADESFREKEYKEAKLDYQDALQIKPYEKYPQDQIKKIDQLLKGEQEQMANEKIEEDYKKAIAKADDWLSKKSYSVAKQEYNNALALKPNEAYPKQKISEIDNLLADQKAIEEKDKVYKETIARADVMFNGNNLENAKTEYTKAMGIKPNEEYPKKKIAEIDSRIKTMADTKALEDAYKEAIAEADKLLADKNLPAAKDKYNSALKLKANEIYPKTKISEIDKLLADMQAAEAKDKSYQDAIASADKMLNEKKYNEAKSEYNKASGIKPAEQYPKTKISEIDKLLADMQAAEAKDKSYQDAIASADKMLNEKKYNEAKSEYNKASGIKPTEQYPKTKISEIDKLLADMQAAEAKDKSYQDAIASADKMLNEKKYNEAKSEYNKASGIKPTEQYPKTKISEIDKLLADMQAAEAKDKSYQDAIASADKMLNEKKYNEAKSEYNKASGIKPTEQYPKTKISEIDKLLADMQAAEAKDKSYQDAIASADKMLNEKKYNEAKSGIQQSLRHKTD